MVLSTGAENLVPSGANASLAAMKIEIPADATAAPPVIKVEIPQDSQHKRTESHPPPLPLGPLRVEDHTGSCPVLIPARDMSPTESAPRIRSFSFSQANTTFFAPNRRAEKDLDYWKSQVADFRRQNLALQVRCQLAEKAFSNAKNMISNLILLYKGVETAEPELILGMGMKLRVAPDMGNLSVVQDLLRKTNAIAEKILLYNFELQKNLTDLKEDNQQLRNANEALKENLFISPENRVASFEVSPKNPLFANVHERAVSNAFKMDALGTVPECTVGALGVFGGIYPNPEQAIPPPSDLVTSATTQLSVQPTSMSEPLKLIQEVIETGHKTPTDAETRWRALVSKLKEEIVAANTKVKKLERRIRVMVGAKYEMIENFSIELERLRS